jgi:hypothetical protein
MRVVSFVVVGFSVTMIAPGLAAQGLGPSGATARCQDGRFSSQKSESVACKDHGGIATWYGLADSSGSHASKKTDVVALLEAAIAQEPPNSVIRADPDGSILLRSTDSAKVDPYSLFTEYLNQAHQESACRRMSGHCVACTNPGHRIYCTNVAKWLPLPPF